MGLVSIKGIEIGYIEKEFGIKLNSYMLLYTKVSYDI